MNEQGLTKTELACAFWARDVVECTGREGWDLGTPCLVAHADTGPAEVMKIIVGFLHSSFEVGFIG